MFDSYDGRETSSGLFTPFIDDSDLTVLIADEGGARGTSNVQANLQQDHTHQHHMDSDRLEHEAVGPAYAAVTCRNDQPSETPTSSTGEWRSVAEVLCSSPRPDDEEEQSMIGPSRSFDSREASITGDLLTMMPKGTSHDWDAPKTHQNPSDVSKTCRDWTTQGPQHLNALGPMPAGQLEDLLSILAAQVAPPGQQVSDHARHPAANALEQTHSVQQHTPRRTAVTGSNRRESVEEDESAGSDRTDEEISEDASYDEIGDSDEDEDEEDARACGNNKRRRRRKSSSGAISTKRRRTQPASWLGDASAEAKAELTRQRNREHARSTRQRKKQYVEQLKKQVADLLAKQQLLNSLESASGTELSPQRVERNEGRKLLVAVFLNSRLASVIDRDKWRELVDDHFKATLPRTPFRCEPHVSPTEQRHVPPGARRLKGVDALVRDTLSVAEMVNMIRRRAKLLARRAKPTCRTKNSSLEEKKHDEDAASAAQAAAAAASENVLLRRESAAAAIELRCTADAADMVIVGDRLMAHWKIASCGLVDAGLENEVKVDGFARVTFYKNKLREVELTFDALSVTTQLLELDLIDLSLVRADSIVNGDLPTSGVASPERISAGPLQDDSSSPRPIEQALITKIARGSSHIAVQNPSLPHPGLLPPVAFQPLANLARLTQPIARLFPSPTFAQPPNWPPQHSQNSVAVFAHLAQQQAARHMQLMHQPLLPEPRQSQPVTNQIPIFPAQPQAVTQQVLPLPAQPELTPPPDLDQSVGNSGSASLPTEPSALFSGPGAII